MDPFSITVGTLALLSAVKATGKVARKLLRLRNVPQEVIRLSNELTDFEITVTKTKVIVDRLSKEEDSVAYIDSFAKIQAKATHTIEKLQTLLQDLLRNNHEVDRLHPETSTADTTEFSKRAWLRKQSDAMRLCAEMKAIREEINNELITASSWAVLGVLQFCTELREIRTVSSQATSSMAGQDEHNRSPRQPPPPTYTIGTESDDTSSQEPTTDPPTYGNQPILDEDSKEIVLVGDLASPVTQGPSKAESIQQNPSLSSSGTERMFHVATSTYSVRPCRQHLCACQCHKMSRVQPLAWVSKLMGSLFIGYSGVTLPFAAPVQCTERSCQQKEKGVVKATYYFPDWMPFARRMVSLYDSWNSFDGHQLHVKFPRVVPASSELFVLAQKGNIEGIQRLFAEKRASVYDVNDLEGRSALHFALTAGQPTMAKFLLSQQADVKLEDKYSLSPVDTLWNYLLEDPKKPEYVAFKEAFGGNLDESEDLQKRNFSRIHLIVFGFSQLSLDDYLKHGCSDIDAQCSFGRTPLCWAIQSPDSSEIVQTLVAHGAAIHIPDIRGQTPVHLGAETGSYEGLQILLLAASNLTGANDYQSDLCDRIRNLVFSGEATESFSPSLGNVDVTVTDFCRDLIEATDYKGRTAIHFATRTNHIEHARLLLRYGANADHADSVGRTPLSIAIYWNHHGMIQLLLEHKARLDLIDNNRMTILHYVAKFGDLETILIFSRENIVGIGPNCRDSEGYTPEDAFLRLRPSMLREGEQENATAREVFSSLMDRLGCEVPET